jgi:hypothetical protein
MMNQEDIFKKIGQILSELNEQYQYLAQNPHELNDLELELFLANANFLGDHVQIIKKINSPAVRNILPEHTESQGDQPLLQQDVLPDEEPGPDEEPVPDEEPAVLPAKEPEQNTVKPGLEEEIFKLDERPSSFEFILSDRPSNDKFEFEEKSIDEIFDRPLSKEEENIIAQKQKLKEKKELEMESPGGEEDEIGPEPFLVTEPVHEEEPVAPEAPGELFAPVPSEEVMASPEEVAPGPEIIAPEPQPDKPVTEIPKLTLNDMLAVANNKSVNTGGSRMAVTDLKQAISLNDKLRYIKDLFNGYNLAYAEAIDLLNKMPDFKTADAFLQKNYAVKNNWAAKQETAEQFYELLNLRFPAK